MGRNNDGQHYDDHTPAADSGQAHRGAPGRAVAGGGSGRVGDAPGGSGSSYPESSMRRIKPSADISTETKVK